MTRVSGAFARLCVLTTLAVPVPAPAAGQAGADPSPLTLAGPAKRYCSGLWVSGRDRAEALENSVLINSRLSEMHESGALTFEIDEARWIVTARGGSSSASARYFGDQGCVILRPETDAPMFTPVAVASELPNAETTPWPMGDLLPEEPLGPDVDGELLDEAARVFFSNDLDRRAAFIVVYKGRIVKEAYGSGAHKDMQLESWSMGKSMTATYIGRLIQMGHLELMQPAPVPRWQNTPGDPRAEIRIADLLQMSSGLRFSGGGSSEEQMAASYIPGFADHGLPYSAPIDAFQFSISRDVEHPPGTVGRYRNSDPWTLGYIVRNVVENRLGEPYHTWPQRALFDKIGIRRFIAETDIYGNFILTGYNYGTARDWARLGLLYLQRGLWNGERLLPEAFVDFVRSPAPGWEDGTYGGLFWLNPPGTESGFTVPSLPNDAYYAVGAGSQTTYVIPSKDLVIVAMSHRAGDALAPDRHERAFEALGLAVKAVDASWTW